MAGNTDIYSAVADRIIAKLEQGVVPWKKPWTTPYPANGDSERPYRGINVFLLMLEAEDKGYRSPWWLTFAQSLKISGYEWERTGKRGEYRYKYAKGRKACRLLGYDENKKPIRGDEFTIDAVRHEDDGVIRLIDADRNSYIVGEDATDPKYGVKKGEKGTQIIFWKPIESVARDGSGNVVLDSATGEPLMERRFILRTYTVFNTEQCHLPMTFNPDGIETRHDEMFPVTAAREAAEIYCSDLGGPELSHGSAAWYRPSSDLVCVPTMDRFISPAHYYATLFHELAHSTGHEKRLNRIESATFGSEPYAREELVAEMAAAMMMGVCGVVEDWSVEQPAAYIKSWLKVLKDDPQMVVVAAAQAQRACDHMLGVTFGGDDDE